MELHPALAAVAGLLGTWRGEGHGEYPTISSFDYTEEVAFSHAGKPFLQYLQRTWSPAGVPMHTETGFLRVIEGQRVEFILAQPTGQTELAEGQLEATTEGLRFRLADRIANSASAKQVDATERDLVLAGDNAIVVGALAAGLPPEQRRQVILIGIAAALVLRIAFALIVSWVMGFVGLVFAGGLLLLWVSWKFWRELRCGSIGGTPDADRSGIAPPRSFLAAAASVAIADVSMSLDNVLAVAGAALHGVGVPACVGTARAAAERVAEQWVAATAR